MVRTKRQRSVDQYPHADILINGNRVKKHSGNVVYMVNDTEFQIELDNNTNKNWMAKIKMDGKYISDAGIVVRTGERAVIERFIDENRKFQFQTYNVNENRQEAIEENGNVIIEFYKEEYIEKLWITNPNPIRWPDIKPTKPKPWWEYQPWVTTTWGDSSTNLTGSVGNISGMYMNSLGEMPVSANPHRDSGGLYGQGRFGYSADIETGQVGKGNASSQTFVNVNMDFNSFASHTLTYKILPLSQKQFVENKEIRQYCTRCGKRRKKGENYCPQCGNKY